ncbi:MAG TPA: mechanosensitive ion channel family protein [Bacteroidia bacterium]|nr:mechanosensitive ion channel family protein [Bacteroidia bacterium]
MQKLQEFLDSTFIAPNTVRDWWFFVLIILSGLVLRTLVARVLTKIIFSVFRKKPTDTVGFQKLFELVKKPWHYFILFVVIYIACRQLTWPPEWSMTPPGELGLRMVLERLIRALIEISFTWILLRLVDFFGLVLHHRAIQTTGKDDDQLVPFLRESIKVIVVILAVFFLLGSVFHLNVASLVAGLGIGGIAVALAAKESLENLIASFTIFLDKPFMVGDIIQMGDKTGTIEKIGFRSTRIRGEDRNYVTIPNHKLVENEIVNLTMRTARRVRFTVGLVYSTRPEQIRKIVADILHFIETHPQTSFEGDNRVNLFELSSSSIDVQVTCYIPDLDYTLFLKTKEEINFAIMDIVEKNGSSFAFPSTSVYIEKK